jgi:gp16 family phage-associated protein
MINQPTSHSTLRTPAEVLAWFRVNRITIVGWCRDNGFSRNVVNALLYQNLPGKRGQANQAAILLGLRASSQQAAKGETNE